ncbi:alpha/beta hydrolase [Kribbella lupini]|uniref:Alpha/beta fold hydrolase n=1 Tax=Kribbella lupini TaxID=291602 RepID=A0ABN1ZYI8_9ACTN
MTTFVLVHGAWHGPWAWDLVVPLLRGAGARTLVPDLSAVGDRGLHDHASIVIDALASVPPDDELVLVGHSYAGLVVREAADARPTSVDHLVLLDGWAGPDGASMFSLAPEAFVTAIRSAAEKTGDGHIPAPPPAAFGITDSTTANWLAARLLPQALRTFTEPTTLTGAVAQIPGTALYCEPLTYPFDRLGAAAGYPTHALSAPHDAMLTHPEVVARMLLQCSRAAQSAS